MKKLILFFVVVLIVGCSKDDNGASRNSDPIIGTWYFNADEYGYWDYSNYRLTFSEDGYLKIEAYDNSANEIEFSHTCQWSNQTSDDFTLLNYNYKFTNFDYGDGSSNWTISVTFSSNYNIHYWNKGSSDLYMTREN